MSKLYAFLHPKTEGLAKDIVVSDRFADEEGNVQPFSIKALTQEDNDRITRLSMKKTSKGEEELDSVEYSRRLVIEGTTFPDFRNQELAVQYGTMDPLEVPGKMLLGGEFKILMKEIMVLSGFKPNPATEAKN